MAAEKEIIFRYVENGLLSFAFNSVINILFVNFTLLSTRNSLFTSVYAAIVCFAAYACISAFRKAFNVAPYSGYQVAGMDYKVVIVISQVAGYMLSKFYG